MTVGKIRTLLVEDQEIARLGLKLVLDGEHIEVIGEAADGLSAVEKTLLLSPDVILMDIGLPEFDGIEATRRIKASQPGVRVLMMTSHDHVDDVFASLSAGADGYCLKETSIDLIVAAVKIVMAGGVFLDRRIARLLVGYMEEQKNGNGEESAPIKKDSQFGLSPREMEILALVVEGFSNPEMAERLFISNETVKTHMRHIMEKLMVADRTQAAMKALRAGLFAQRAAVQ